MYFLRTPITKTDCQNKRNIACLIKFLLYNYLTNELNCFVD